MSDIEKIINDAWENRDNVNQDSEQNLKDTINQMISDLDSGKISSIHREKNAAKEVGVGLECGIILKDFADYKEKDIIEAFSVTTSRRKI